MRKLAAGLMLAAVVGFIGCENETPPATTGGGAAGGSGQSEREGGAGQAANGKGTAANGQDVDEEMTFTIEGLPTQNVDIEQGDSQNETFDIDRGDKFTEAVTLTFTAPEGITIVAAGGDAGAKGIAVPADQEDVEVTITVAPTAPVGEHVVTVTGKSASGKMTDGKFTVEVNKAGEGLDLNPNASDADPVLPDPDAPADPTPETN